MTTTPRSVTPEAITNAAVAIAEVLERHLARQTYGAEWVRGVAFDAATEALAAAGPAIAGAERDAAIALAEQHGATYPSGEPCGKAHCADPARCPARFIRHSAFADLLRSQ